LLGVPSQENERACILLLGVPRQADERSCIFLLGVARPWLGKPSKNIHDRSFS
jgi:hypothetical protein